MSSAFVSSEPVPVKDDEGNTIYILPKMPYGVKQRVTHAMFHLEAKTEAGDLVVQDNVEVDLATHNLLLLKANVTSWHGPAFGDTPFSADALERLDPDFSLLDKVLGEINARNYVQKKSRAEKKRVRERWARRFDGKLKQPAGDWDWYIILADRFGWTPQEVDALDPDFIDELDSWMAADGDYAKVLKKRAEAEARARAKQGR